MAQRVDGVVVLAGLALAGSSLTTVSFVPSSSGPAPTGQTRGALRGADGQAGSAARPRAEERPQGSSWLQLAGAAGALALAGRLAGRTASASGCAVRAGGRVLCRAEKAAEAKAAEDAAAGEEQEDKAVAKEPLGYWDPREEVGVTEPLGYWDPAGFSKADDKKGFQNLRASEVKHGRVAMMAAAGAVAQHFVKFPGFEGVPAGLNAVLTPPGSYGVILLLVVAGGLELGLWTESSDKEPGNFGDPLGLGSYDADMRNRELNNGRFAMFAAIGIIAAELLTGKDAVSQFGA